MYSRLLALDECGEGISIVEMKKLAVMVVEIKGEGEPFYVDWFRNCGEQKLLKKLLTKGEGGANI